MKIEDIENNLILQANSLNSVLERKINEVENMGVREILIKNVDNSRTSTKQELKMKFEHLDIEIQKIAAEHLAAQLGARVNMEDENRMEQEKKIAETIRVAF